MPKRKGKKNKKKTKPKKGVAKTTVVQESKPDVADVFNKIYENLQSIFTFIFNSAPFISEGIKTAFKDYTSFSGFEIDSVYHPSDCFMPIRSFSFISSKHGIHCCVCYIRSAKRHGFGKSDWADEKYHMFLIIGDKTFQDPILDFSLLDDVSFNISYYTDLDALNRCLCLINDLLEEYESLRTDFLLSTSIGREGSVHSTSQKLSKKLLQKKKNQAEVLEQKIIHLFTSVNSALLRYVVIAKNGNVSAIQQKDYGFIVSETMDKLPDLVPLGNIQELISIFEASRVFIFYCQFLDALDKQRDVKQKALAEDRASAVEFRTLFEQMLLEEKQAQTDKMHQTDSSLFQAPT